MKKHPFTPGVTVTRGQNVTSRCQVCDKAGRRMSRQISGRQVTYWQHNERPEVEPTQSAGACDWQGTGKVWCCKSQGHSGGHHVHRGERREVGH